MDKLVKNGPSSSLRLRFAFTALSRESFSMAEERIFLFLGTFRRLTLAPSTNALKNRG